MKDESDPNEFAKDLRDAKTVREEAEKDGATAAGWAKRPKTLREEQAENEAEDRSRERSYDFGWALKQMHQGDRVERRGWNGKGMWLRSERMTLPYIFMRTVQGDLVPWLASQTDMLAELEGAVPDIITQIVVKERIESVTIWRETSHVDSRRSSTWGVRVNGAKVTMVPATDVYGTLLRMIANKR